MNEQPEIQGESTLTLIHNIVSNVHANESSDTINHF